MQNNGKNNGIFGENKGKFFSVLIVAGVFFLTVAVIGPTIEGIFQTKTNIADLKNQFALLFAKEELLKKTDGTALTSQARKLNNAIPSVINLPLILATLQKTAATTSVSIGKFSIATNVAAVTLIPVNHADKLSSFQFKVNLSGSFDNIERFIEQLGNITPLLRVISLEFSQEESSVVLSFYFQPGDTKTKIDTPLVQLTDKQNKALEKIFELEPPVIEESIQSSSSGASRTTPFR